jgi:signal transduction histidine kinase
VVEWSRGVRRRPLAGDGPRAVNRARRAGALGFSLAVAVGALAVLWALAPGPTARWVLTALSVAAWIACAGLLFAPLAARRRPSEPTLVAHLHDSFDRERERIASELHDELGSMLIATKMTVELAGREVSAPPPGLTARFASIQEALRSALALERRLSDELYPSLLRHVGLFAALRGHLARTGERTVTVTAPEDELAVTRQQALAVFRTAEAAVRGVQTATAGGPVDVSVTNSAQWLELIVSGQACAPSLAATRAAEQEFADSEARAHGLGGEWQRSNATAGGQRLTIRIPLPATA